MKQYTRKELRDLTSEQFEALSAEEKEYVTLLKEIGHIK